MSVIVCTYCIIKDFECLPRLKVHRSVRRFLQNLSPATASPTPKLRGYHVVMTNIAMERSAMLLIGKPSISMGHLYHGYVK